MKMLNEMKEEFIVFGAPKIEQAEIDEVVQSMTSGWLGTGPKVAQFEKDFRVYKSGWGYPVAVNSCTAALHLSLIGAGVGPGDEVITTPLTFCATVNAIIHAGGTPVLADIDPVTLNIDPTKIEEAVSDRTKVILPVHYAGRPCDMEAIMKIADDRSLQLIEDCAHSIETIYKGRHAGTFGDFGCFSFYVTKNMVTGEGGLILAKTEELASHLKTLALHGMSNDAWKRFSDSGYQHYQVIESGFKYNMMDIQAAIGIHQLKRIDSYLVRREEIWNRYNDAFADLPCVLPADPEPDTRHARHLYTLLINGDSGGISRDEFLVEMTGRNVGVGVHYMSVPEHPVYQDRYGWSPDDYPVARDAGRQTVSLPISAKLSDEDVSRIINAVIDLVQK